jgi:hypothetical protein
VLGERFGRVPRLVRDDRKDFLFGSNGVNVPRSSLAGRVVLNHPHPALHDGLLSFAATRRPSEGQSLAITQSEFPLTGRKPNPSLFRNSRSTTRTFPYNTVVNSP